MNLEGCEARWLMKLWLTVRRTDGGPVAQSREREAAGAAPGCALLFSTPFRDWLRACPCAA